MENLKTSIQNTLQEFKKELETSSDQSHLEIVRLKYLGKQGKVADVMASLATLTSEEKRIFGPLLNELKKTIQDLLTQAQQDFISKKNEAEAAQKANFDVTVQPFALQGSLHPYTLITQEIEDIFISMGFAVADGPELENEFNNFTGLNIPADHPAREESDTFWLPGFTHLLRTQTSPVQIRTMQSQKPPIAIIVPGRVLRNEATDATHDFMFMQLEGIYIDKNVSMSNLLAVLETFLKKLLGNEIELRFRPGFFPFVEPGIEIDALYSFDKNKPAKWMELLGAGMIHPNVLRHGGIDPEEYSGFAFGMGITRLAMLKYNISDLRIIHSSNTKFLSQF